LQTGEVLQDFHLLSDGELYQNIKSWGSLYDTMGNLMGKTYHIRGFDGNTLKLSYTSPGVTYNPDIQSDDIMYITKVDERTLKVDLWGSQDGAILIKIHD